MNHCYKYSLLKTHIRVKSSFAFLILVFHKDGKTSALTLSRFRKEINIVVFAITILIFLSVQIRHATAQTTLSDGYDVVLLAGQSNMAGRAILDASDPDAAVNSRIFMWDPVNGIVPAKDPIVHQEPIKNGTAGLGLTFAKEYLQRIPSNRKILLVGAAYGGTAFYKEVLIPTDRWNFNL